MPSTLTRRGALGRATAPSFPTAALLALAVALGALLRLLPCLRDPDFQFVVDAAYHERLVQQALAAGHVPRIDPMSVPPAGRETARLLPTALYGVAAACHRAAAALGARDLRWNLAVLIALLGGLIAVPVWLATRALFGHPAAALFAAFVSVAVPAHLVRSYGYWLRYDAPGVLLVTLHWAFAFAALTSTLPRTRRIHAIASAVALVGALATWRVSLFAIPVDLLFVAWRFATRGAESEVREWWTASVAIGIAGAIGIEYLSAARFAASPLALGALGSCALLWLPGLRHRPARIGALAVLGGAALLAGHSAASGGGVTLPAVIAARLGLAHGHDPVAALMLEIEELYPMSPLRLLFDPRELVVLGPWLVVAPVAVWRLGRVADRAPGPAPVLLAFVAGALVALTLLFARTSALLAPIACVVLGGVIARGAVQRAALPWLAWVALASGAVTAVTGVVHALGAWSHLGADESRALRFVAEHTPPNAIVATSWDVGYDLQARGRRASLVDGLIEDDENRRRIVALDRALMERRAEPLARLCDHYGARWLLVPDPTSLQSVAAVAGDPVAGKIVRGEPLIEGVDTDRVLYHLMMGDAPTAGFRRAFASGGWSVYEREAPRE